MVLWPDDATSVLVRVIWDELEAAGVPTLASHTHRLHVPHASLVVAEHLPVAETLAATGPVPTQPIPLLVEAVSVFPEGGMVLAVVMNDQLLAEQQRVHRSALHLATDPWDHFTPGTWTPHMTCARSLDAEQLRVALPIVLAHLPIRGRFDRGGVEDGTTGEKWPSGPRPR